MGDKHVLFMKNHGVVVIGDTVAQAYRRLYKLERVCRTQVLALSTGEPIEVLADDVIARVQTPSDDDRHPRAERETPVLRGHDAGRSTASCRATPTDPSASVYANFAG